MGGGLVPLSRDWALWPDIAVRSAGFPVSGLDAFGPGDEQGRLREVARDPRLQEAVTWQNPAALEHAVVNVAAGTATKPSRMRQREEVVASYWQRYCAKNDTIGFFGPLAWGRLDGAATAFAVRSGAVERERCVYLEAWGVQALAETLDPSLAVAAGPHTEAELRAALDGHPDAAVRAAGLRALARLEQARDAVAAAPAAELRGALAALDAVFVELTGREPVRNQGRAYGARTLAYVDCLRDLDVTIGAPVLAELAPPLEVLFEATRWYCGEVHAIGREVVERALPPGGGPLLPVIAEVLPALMRPSPALGEVVGEVRRRLAGVLAGADPATAAARAVAAFADHRPAWPTAAFQSVDLQLAARDPSAIAAGEYLAVVGDVHPGTTPLQQGVFAHRHPDPAAYMHALMDGVGAGVAWLLPPWGPGLAVDARGIGLTPPDDVHIAAMPGTRAQAPRRTWDARELRVEGRDVVDRTGALRVDVVAVFAMPIFVSGVRAFDLLPDEPHAERVTLGRTVLRREAWSVPAGELPPRPEDLAAFARDRGMPRRVFVKSPLERKPMYLDVESPVLCRVLCRHARRAAEEAPGAPMAFTEMFPGPDECWLADPDGNRYVSELRLVATDRTRLR